MQCCSKSPYIVQALTIFLHSHIDMFPFYDLRIETEVFKLLYVSFPRWQYWGCVCYRHIQWSDNTGKELQP